MDQHALMKRIRYRTIKGRPETSGNSNQEFLPISIELNPKEMSQLQAVSSTIKSFGFEFARRQIDDEISSAVLTSSSIEDFLRDLLQDLSEDNEVHPYEKIKDEMVSTCMESREGKCSYPLLK